MLLISKPSFAHIGDGLVEPPGPFIKMGNGEFHPDATKSERRFDLPIELQKRRFARRSSATTSSNRATRIDSPRVTLAWESKVVAAAACGRMELNADASLTLISAFPSLSPRAMFSKSPVSVAASACRLAWV